MCTGGQLIAHRLLSETTRRGQARQHRHHGPARAGSTSRRADGPQSSTRGTRRRHGVRAQRVSGIA